MKQSHRQSQPTANRSGSFGNVFTEAGHLLRLFDEAKEPQSRPEKPTQSKKTTPQRSSSSKPFQKKEAETHEQKLENQTLYATIETHEKTMCANDLPEKTTEKKLEISTTSKSTNSACGSYGTCEATFELPSPKENQPIPTTKEIETQKPGTGEKKKSFLGAAGSWLSKKLTWNKKTNEQQGPPGAMVPPSESSVVNASKDPFFWEVYP